MVLTKLEFRTSRKKIKEKGGSVPFMDAYTEFVAPASVRNTKFVDIIICLTNHQCLQNKNGLKSHGFNPSGLDNSLIFSILVVRVNICVFSIISNYKRWTY